LFQRVLNVPLVEAAFAAQRLEDALHLVGEVVEHSAVKPSRVVIPSVARDLGGGARRTWLPRYPAQVPRYARDDKRRSTRYARRWLAWPSNMPRISTAISSSTPRALTATPAGKS